MASVTVNLTGVQHATDRLTWLDDVSLGSIFSFDGDNIGLSHFAVYDLGNVAIGLTGIGDRFTTAFEATGRIIAMSSDGETLEVMIANADMTEPYFGFRQIPQTLSLSLPMFGGLLTRPPPSR